MRVNEVFHVSKQGKRKTAPPPKRAFPEVVSWATSPRGCPQREGGGEAHLLLRLCGGLTTSGGCFSDNARPGFWNFFGIFWDEL